MGRLQKEMFGYAKHGCSNRFASPLWFRRVGVPTHEQSGSSAPDDEGRIPTRLRQVKRRGDGRQLGRIGMGNDNLLLLCTIHDDADVVPWNIGHGRNALDGC